MGQEAFNIFFKSFGAYSKKKIVYIHVAIDLILNGLLNLLKVNKLPTWTIVDRFIRWRIFPRE